MIKMKKILLTLFIAVYTLTVYSQLGLNLNKPERIEEMRHIWVIIRVGT